MTGPGILVEKLTKRFGGRVAVDALDLVVPRGQVVGLLGFNGAGKSTTMDVLATLSEPTSGRAEVAGCDVMLRPRDARARLAIVFESALPARPTWTAREYLAFFQGLRGMGAPDPAILSMLALDEILDQTTGTMSAGQRKRVELARAMAAKPDVLLLDEPTKEVDMKGKRIVWDAVRAEAARGASVLVSTHDVMEVRALCDRVEVLHEGRLTASLGKAQIQGADPVRLEQLLVARMEGR